MHIFPNLFLFFKRGEKMEKSRVFSEFMFSDLQLGIFENEVFYQEHKKAIRLIVFNRLNMILNLNNKLIAN
jgi:hypothetical protein